MSKEVDVRLSHYSKKEGWNTIRITNPQKANVEILCETELIVYKKNQLAVQILSFRCVPGPVLSILY